MRISRINVEVRCTDGDGLAKNHLRTDPQYYQYASDFMYDCRSVDGTKLKELAIGILDRRLYKAVDATVAGSSRDDFVEQVKGVIRNKGMLPVESLVKDATSNTPYKPTIQMDTSQTTRFTSKTPWVNKLSFQPSQNRSVS